MSDPITLWGRSSSVNVQKAVWALEELGLNYERIDAGGKFGGLETPEFGKMNPNRRVPVLRDGELILWESSAIVRYLSARYGAGGLWPEAAADRAVSDQWADWTIATFQPTWLTLFSLIVRVPPAKRDPAAIASALAASVDLFAMLDAELAKTPFLGGAQMTFADIMAGSALYRWTTLEIERPDLPHVAAWHQRLLERPAFVKGVNVSYLELMAKGD